MATTSASTVDTSRYNYLVDRLRNRRITMEEATELFAIQQAMIRAAYQSRIGLPPPPPSPPTAGAATASTRSSAPSPAAPGSPAALAGLFGSDEALMLGLLALGAGAGLMAALAKQTRSESGSSNGTRAKPTNRTG